MSAKTSAMLVGRSKSSMGRPTLRTVRSCDAAAASSATASWPEPPVIRIGAAISGRVPFGTIGQARQSTILVGQDRLRWRHRPGNGERRIVPQHAAFRLAIPRRGDLIDHLGNRLDCAVTVQQSRWYPQLTPVLGGR